MTTETPTAEEIETMEDDADDCEWTNCENCRESVPIADTDDDGFCLACQLLHFVCEECEGRVLLTDAHPTRTGLCQDCGESKDEEERQDALDAAAEELDGLVDEIKGTEDLARLAKAIKALKRLTK